MVSSQPSPHRIRVRREIGGLSITIAARRNWGLILFLGFWLCGWLMGESFALKALLTGRAGIGGSLFLLVWLAFWTVGGAAAWLTFLWALTGEETIVIGPDGMSVRRTVLGLGGARVVPTRALRNLRVSPVGVSWTRTNGRGRLERGRIAVDAEGETVRFGADLDDQECDYLLGAIRSEVDIPTSALQAAPAAIPLPA